MACDVPMVSGKGWVGNLAQKMLFNTDVEFTTVTTSSNLKESAFEPSAGDISRTAASGQGCMME